MSRRSQYRAAVIVHAVNSLVLIVATFPALMQGPGAHTFTEGMPQIVILVFSLLGMAGLVSAYGAWNGQKWGVTLTIFLEAVGGVVTLPGVLFAPSKFGRISSTIGILTNGLRGRDTRCSGGSVWPRRLRIYAATVSVSRKAR